MAAVRSAGDVLLFLGIVALQSIILSLALSFDAVPAVAFSSGITTLSFGVNGCNQCHSGGAVPVVNLSGPTAVEQGATSEYTLTIHQIGSQGRGGLNLSAASGVLSVGGSNSAMTKTLNAAGRAEITHTGSKGAVGSVVTFSFLWTAPNAPATVTLNGWGNAVNGTGSSAGDRAAKASLTVFVAGGAPTPTTTRTTTATASRTPTRTQTSSPTAMPTTLPSATATISPTRSATPSQTATQTATAPPSATATASPTQSTTVTASASQTAAQTATPTASATATLTPTQSTTVTASTSPTLVRTATSTPSATATSPTATATGTPALTLTASPTLTSTARSTAPATTTASHTPASPSATVSPSPSKTATGRPSAPPTINPTDSPTPTATPLPCSGDCHGDGAVTVDELILGVNIALGIQPASQCPPIDTDGNQAVTVDELVKAVTVALNGCAASERAGTALIRTSRASGSAGSAWGLLRSCRDTPPWTIVAVGTVPFVRQPHGVRSDTPGSRITVDESGWAIAGAAFRRRSWAETALS